METGRFNKTDKKLAEEIASYFDSLVRKGRRVQDVHLAIELAIEMFALNHLYDDE